MTPHGWSVRCVLYGKSGDRALEECAALLRGIDALYGDGFAFSISPINNEHTVLSLSQAWGIAAANAAHMVQSPFIRMLCSFADAVDEIVAVGTQEIARVLRAVVERQLTGSHAILGRAAVGTTHVTQNADDGPIKIFVSGDRSQVGKSTCCLGLVGSLLGLGFDAKDIAYIKPATQCEQPQLIAKFCRHMDIECCDIGPIVFYSGFTREYLMGTTESSDELLAKAKAKVDEVGRGKKIVVVDGVGYPAVGSICGVSNANVALAVEAPVVLVGKKGVGDAVDSFNLNACFFESQGVKVLGAIFNRLPVDGFYSLKKCRESVTQYFHQYQPSKRIYGFIPELVEQGQGGSDAMIVDDVCCDDQGVPSIHISSEELRRANQVISLFSRSVDVGQLIADVTKYHASPDLPLPTYTPTLTPLNKRPLASAPTSSSSDGSAKKSRQEIQAEAKASGAAGG